jgi:hypothetical protein
MNGMNKSCWYYVKEFINTYEDGQIFNATLMLHYVRDHKPEYKRRYYYTGKENGVDSLPDVLYSYRVILQRTGYLRQIEKGMWRKIKHIPEHISSYKTKKHAYARKTLELFHLNV